eukprot:g56777.t1
MLSFVGFTKFLDSRSWMRKKEGSVWQAPPGFRETVRRTSSGHPAFVSTAMFTEIFIPMPSGNTVSINCHKLEKVEQIRLKIALHGASEGYFYNGKGKKVVIQV